MSFRLRIVLNILAIAAAAWIVPGVRLSGPLPAIAAGVLLGVVNALIRPVLLLLTLPLTLVTLGLFILVVNAVCFALTAALVPGFDLGGFRAALLGSLIVTVVSWVLNGLFPQGRGAAATAAHGVSLHTVGGGPHVRRGEVGDVIEGEVVRRDER